MLLVLLVSQFFGLLPVSNILADDVQRIHYSWCSVHSVYSGAIIILNTLEFCTVGYLVFKAGLNFHNSGKVLAYEKSDYGATNIGRAYNC